MTCEVAPGPVIAADPGRLQFLVAPDHRSANDLPPKIRCLEPGEIRPAGRWWLPAGPPD